MPPWWVRPHGETVFGSDLMLSKCFDLRIGLVEPRQCACCCYGGFLSLFSLSAWVKLTILVRAAAKSFVNKFYGRKG